MRIFPTKRPTDGRDRIVSTDAGVARVPACGSFPVWSAWPVGSPTGLSKGEHAMVMDSAVTSTVNERADPLDSLRRAVTGPVLGPGDVGWDRARSPWAVAVDQRPLAVVQVADAHDVEAAVRWAVSNGRQVSAQPVGHGAYDALEGVLLLRTRALNAIEVDVAGGTVTVGAGVKVGELLAALQGTGWTFLAGSNGDPTVVAMTIGGGLSWFGRAHGMTANRVLRADLVDAHGHSRQVSAAADPDLFWAVRGGGGDFGIITSLKLELVPGPQLYGGQLMWPVEQMAAVLAAFREVTTSAPEQLSLWYATMRFPPLPVIPEPLRGRAFAAVAVAFLGLEDAGRDLLGPLREVPGLALDTLAPMAMEDLGQITAEPVDPTPVMQQSMLLHDLDDDLIADLTAVVGPDSGSPLMMLQIRHLGGALARPDTDGGACGHLVDPYLLFALGVPAVPALVGALQNSFVRLAQAVGGHTDGSTVANFLEPGGDLGRIWPPQTRHRLAQIKQRVDPQSVFRSNRPTG